MYSGEVIPRVLQQEIIDYASRIIFLSHGELEYVRKRLRIDPAKSVIVENGVSADFDREIKAGHYILNVGRIYQQKNQLSLALACRNLHLHLKCVGEIIDEQYAEEVRKAGAELLPNVPQSELVSLYQNSYVLACVSKHEVQPNCVLEGGLCGANIVLTSKCCSFTSGFPNIWICNPTAEGIVSALRKAWVCPKTDDLKRILKEWTWEKVAKKLKVIYKKVLFESIR